MISYTDFDFAITRWKARMGGVPQPAQPVSGAVEAEVPVATAPEPAAEVEEGAVASEEAPGTISGLVASESLLETPSPESLDPDQK